MSAETANHYIENTYLTQRQILCEYFQSREGYKIRVMGWQSSEAIKGTVLILQGFTEFIEKYEEVTVELLNKGYHVVTFDWRGQGLSHRFLDDPLRGYVDSFDAMILECYDIYETYVRKLARPHIMLAHSMGGCIGLRLLQQEHGFDAGIFSSPMLDWHSPVAVAQALSKVMINLGKGSDYGIGSGPPDPEQKEHVRARLTTCQGRIDMITRLYSKNSLFLMGGPTWKWIFEGSRSMRLARRVSNVKKIKIPCLIFSPDGDNVVKTDVNKKLAFYNKSIQVRVVEGCQHEVLMEVDKHRHYFWNEFDLFTTQLNTPQTPENS